MKPSPAKNPPPPKLPRARVMYQTHTFTAKGEFPVVHHDFCPGAKHGVWLPTSTAKQAKALCRWMNKTEGEQRFAIAKQIAAFRMNLPSISDAGFRALRPVRIVEACEVADKILALYFGEGGQR